jgi:NIPSNAP
MVLVSPTYVNVGYDQFKGMEALHETVPHRIECHVSSGDRRDRIFSEGFGWAGQNTRVYELRTYTTLPGRLPALNKRFAEHTIQLFEKHGMKSEMYWMPTDEPLKDNTLIYVISHESREAADKNWKEFQADPDWIKVRDDSEADGKILAKPPERVFMTATVYSPRQ